METKTSATESSGCGQAILRGTLLMWLFVIPAGVTFVLSTVLAGRIPPPILSAAIIALIALLLLVPFVGVLVFARRQVWPQETVALAAALLIVTGAILLEILVRAVAPTDSSATPYGEGLGGAVLRLCLLLPYAAFSARLATRLIGVGPESLWSWLGLDRFDLIAVLVALAAAALVTVSWPVTGALGDGLTSLSVAFQMLSRVIPQVLMLWGVVFRLLILKSAKPWRAVLTIVLLYGAYVLSGIAPTADWGVLWDAVFLLPLASLLTQLRTRKSGVYPLILLSFCYQVAPLLFADPRDVLAQEGIPELQHLLSYTISIVTATVLVLVFGSVWPPPHW